MDTILMAFTAIYEFTVDTVGLQNAIPLAMVTIGTPIILSLKQVGGNTEEA